MGKASAPPLLRPPLGEEEALLLPLPPPLLPRLLSGGLLDIFCQITIVAVLLMSAVMLAILNEFVAAILGGFMRSTENSVSQSPIHSGFEPRSLRTFSILAFSVHVLLVLQLTNGCTMSLLLCWTSTCKLTTLEISRLLSLLFSLFCFCFNLRANPLGGVA